MKSNFLFPNRFKKVGWVLLGIGVLTYVSTFFVGDEPEFMNCKVLALYNHNFMEKPEFFSVFTANIYNELIGVFSIIGAMMVAFSKEKTEDEFIAKIRLESLVWSVFLNYAILLFCIVFIYGMDFLAVMQYNMLTILLFFIARFHFVLYKNSKLRSHEE